LRGGTTLCWGLRSTPWLGQGALAQVLQDQLGGVELLSCETHRTSSERSRGYGPEREESRGEDWMISRREWLRITAGAGAAGPLPGRRPGPGESLHRPVGVEPLHAVRVGMDKVDTEGPALPQVAR
jgi:hypothetical protein